MTKLQCQGQNEAFNHVFFLGTLNQQVEHVDINSDAILDLVFLGPPI